ncbi:MAG TPA: hypothetical protein PKE10_03335 [Candidatus Saccharibacteria bacterium]|nr:hypothetical protein [Candidatus Saccharibacteria bacterium]
MSTRLPIPGGDQNNWGEILNDYLLVSHNTDGTIRTGALGAAHIQDGTITLAKLSAALQAQLSSGNGVDGREIEIRTTATHIQWRYVGTPTWTDLVALTTITGPAGSAGAAGAQGPQGPIGPTGANGTQGTQGPQGPQGPQGSTGATGPAPDTSSFVQKSGDTMTGQLFVNSYGITVDSPGNAFFAIDRNDDTSLAQFEFRTNANQDFVMGVSGSGADRKFRIYTNGAEYDVLYIERSSGNIALQNGVTFTLAAAPTDNMHAATKHYVDSSVSNMQAMLNDKAPITPQANLNVMYSIAYAQAYALGMRPSVPSGCTIRIWGGTSSDPDPTWMITGDYRDMISGS